MATDKFEWDALDHLTRVADQPTNVERYKAWYDADGERVKSRYGGVDHVYSYGSGLLHDSAGGGTVYTPGVGHRQAGVDHYYHSDWLGTTRYTTGATGLASLSAQRFDAWGNVSASAGGHGGSLKWAGGVGYEADGPDGLSMLGARYYDPVVGRFVSPDPISFAGGMNLYAYCGGDPVNAVDPDGTSPGLIVGIGVAGVDGALSASDTYVENHVEDYTWYGHLWANSKGAVGGIFGSFDPRRSVERLGGAVGRYEAGQGSVGEVAHAGLDVGVQTVSITLIAYGATRGSCGANTGILNRGGRYGLLRKLRLIDEVPNHMPQAASLPEMGIKYNDGPALGMSKADHKLTRTFCGRGSKTKSGDSDLTPRERLYLDMKDTRKQFGRRYNRGMLEVGKYAKTKPQFRVKRKRR